MPQPRTHLPIPSAARTGLITYDAKDPDSTYPPIEQLRPPAGAPNVLLILLDDVGFGASSAFEAHAGRRRRNCLPVTGCGTTGFTPPRCARRRVRRC